MRRRRIFAFDLIRVSAMMMVVLFHYNIQCMIRGFSEDYILFLSFANGAMGTIGVSLFFILSGASLMYSNEKTPDWNVFYKKRFLSLYPLYWVAYLIFYVYFYVLNGMLNPAPKWTFLLTFLGMDGYTLYRIPNYYILGEWFFGCIVQIYLVFPILYYLVKKRPVATAAVTAVLYPLYLYMYPFEMDIERCVLTRLPEVMFGMYMVRYLCTEPDGEQRSWKPLSWPVGLSALAVFLICFFVRMPSWPSPISIFLTGSSCTLFLIWFSRLIEWEWLKKPFALLSACSFPVFLVHHVLQIIYLPRHMDLMASFWGNHRLLIQYLLLTMFMSYVLYQVSKILNQLTEIFWNWCSRGFHF